MKKEEMYDIFDTDGNPIGKKSLNEIHEKGFLHQVVACFMFKDKDRQKLLLQRRSFSMKQDPGLWNHSAGGHMICGESTQEAMRRELSEELFEGKELPNLQLREIAVFNNRDLPNNYEVCQLFEVIYGGSVSVQKEEIETVEWVNFHSMRQDVELHPEHYTTSFKNALNTYLLWRSPSTL